MSALIPDIPEAESDGSSGASPQPKRSTPGIAIRLLAGVALVSLTWGATSLYDFARRERAVARRAADPFRRDVMSRWGASIDRQHYERIHPGMTIQQVSNVLGGPPGYYDGVVGFRFAEEPKFGDKGQAPARAWYSRDSCIQIVFEGGRVRDKEFCRGKGLTDAR